MSGVHGRRSAGSHHVTAAHHPFTMVLVLVEEVLRLALGRAVQ